LQNAQELIGARDYLQMKNKIKSTYVILVRFCNGSNAASDDEKQKCLKAAYKVLEARTTQLITMK
jgi:hypothetical protein